MKGYIFLFVISFFVGFLLISATQKAEAIQLPTVKVCHKLVQPHNTLSIPVTALPAHLGHGDSMGACVSISLTPTPSVEPTASPSAVPTTSVPLTAPVQTITNNNTTEKVTERTIEVRIPQAPPTTGRAK